MKKCIFNIGIAVFAIILLTIFGIDEIRTHRIGLAIMTFVIAAINVGSIYLHWHKYRGTCNDSARLL